MKGNFAIQAVASEIDKLSTLLENPLLDANTKPETKSNPNLSPRPDPVSGFSWVVSGENEQFWKVEKNLFYKTFQINKTSFQLEDLKSKAFDFKEYSNFLEDKIKLQSLDDKLLKFLPFNKKEFKNDFDKWEHDYKKENTKVLINNTGKAWLEELTKSDTTLDDEYKNFIEKKLRVKNNLIFFMIFLFI